MKLAQVLQLVATAYYSANCKGTIIFCIVNIFFHHMHTILLCVQKWRRLILEYIVVICCWKPVTVQWESSVNLTNHLQLAKLKPSKVVVTINNPLASFAKHSPHQTSLQDHRQGEYRNLIGCQQGSMFCRLLVLLYRSLVLLCRSLPRRLHKQMA